MAITQLSPTGLPGARYSFSAKDPASGKGTGPFTALSSIATPGRIPSFLAKTPEVTTSEQITALSVMALPGPTRTFTAKEFAGVEIPIPPVEEPEVVPEPARGGLIAEPRELQQRRRLLAQARREDKIIMEVIKLFLEEVNK